MKSVRKYLISFLVAGMIIASAACVPQAGSGAPTGQPQGVQPTELATQPTEVPTELAPTATPESTETPAILPDLAGTRWDLVSLGSTGSETAAIEGSNVTIAFNADNTFDGNSGCNSFHGDYKIDKGSLVLSNVIGTLKACLDDPITRQEGVILQALNSVQSYTISGDQLILSYDGGKSQLIFAGSKSVSMPGAHPAAVRAIQMLDAQNGWAVGAGDGQTPLPLLFTSDGGQNWQDRTPTSVAASAPSYGSNIPAFYFESAQRGWISYPVIPGQAAGEQPSIWLTQDGGQTWTGQPLELGDLAMENFFPSDLNFFDPQLGWIVAHLGAGMMHDYIAIFLTTDGGATWKRVSDPNQNGDIQSCAKTGVGFISQTEGWLAADCPGLMPDLSLFHTTNGGTSWNRENLPLPVSGMPADLGSHMGDQCGISQLTVDGMDNVRLVLRCTDFNTSTSQAWLYTRQGGAAEWQSAALPVANGSLGFMSPAEGWMLGSQDSDFTAPRELFHTTDGGQTWTSIAQNLIGNQVDFTDPLNGWIASGGYLDAPLLRTTDGGVTWK